MQHISRSFVDFLKSTPSAKYNKIALLCRELVPAAISNFYKLRDTNFKYINRNLRMTMYLHFAWARVAETRACSTMDLDNTSSSESLSRTLYTTTSTSMDHCYRDGEWQTFGSGLGRALTRSLCSSVWPGSTRATQTKNLHECSLPPL